MAARIAAAERAIQSSETDRRELWKDAMATKQIAAVQERDLAEIRGDLHDVVAELRWVKRGMWAAAASGLSVALAVAALVLNHA